MHLITWLLELGKRKVVNRMKIRQINQAGIDLLKKFEGFSSHIYKDVAGYDTVGYGHLVRSGEKFTIPMSQNNAEKLLKLDIIKAEQCINENCHRELTDNQFSALCCLVYNIGCGAFKGSTLLLMLNKYSPIRECANQFLRWNKVGSVEIEGLTNRRAAEKELFLLDA